MSATSKFASLPRGKTLTGKPPTNEERVLTALDRHFPGSEWIVELPSASTSPGPPDALPSGGTGALDFVVIVGSEYDPKKIKRWAAGHSGTRVMTGSPRVAPKAGTPLNGEAVVTEHLPDAIVCPWGEEYLGKNYRSLQPSLLVGIAQAEGAEVVLVGKGKKIDAARAALELMGDSAPSSSVVDAK